jgi:hypothetical protein
MSKAQQLYEMILVRHGLMLVGHSYGAKTSVYRCGDESPCCCARACVTHTKGAEGAGVGQRSCSCSQSQRQ